MVWASRDCLVAQKLKFYTPSSLGLWDRMSSIRPPLGAYCYGHHRWSTRLDLLFVLDPSLMLPNTVAWPQED